MYHITRDQMSVIIADDTGIRDSASITSLLDGIATMSDSKQFVPLDSFIDILWRGFVAPNLQAFIAIITKIYHTHI